MSRLRGVRRAVILLASRSPQRRGLLSTIGVEHRVVSSPYEEAPIPGATPDALVLAHARGKARAVAQRLPPTGGDGVLGADTAVVIDGAVLGKPVDQADAARMLMLLSGRRHTVLSALCLIAPDGETTTVAAADVVFRPIDARLLAWYLARGEWQGRAGGYAMQGSGATLVQAIDGDPTTVIGLPIAALSELLEAAGMAPWGDVRPSDLT